MASAIEDAQKRLNEDKERAPVASDDPQQQPKKKGREEIGKQFDAPTDPDDLPDWLEPMDRFRVKVSDGDSYVILTDPGGKWNKVMMDDEIGETSVGREMIPIVYARAVADCKITALHPAFGVEPGDRLPHPGKFLDDHRKQWKEWRREVKRVGHQNLNKSLSDQKGDREMEPEEPETELTQLIYEEWPMVLVERINLAIYYVMMGADNRWRGILRAHQRAQAKAAEAIRNLEVQLPAEKKKEADAQGN